MVSVLPQLEFATPRFRLPPEIHFEPVPVTVTRLLCELPEFPSVPLPVVNKKPPLVTRTLLFPDGEAVPTISVLTFVTIAPPMPAVLPSTIILLPVPWLPIVRA